MKNENKNENVPVKPGWKTTEFWLAAIPSVVALLISAGWIGQQQVDSVIAHLTAIATGVCALVGTVYYMYTRVVVKIEQLKANGAIAALEELTKAEPTQDSGEKKNGQ